MFKVSIEDTLKHHKKEEFKGLQSEPVKQVKLLLESDATEELRILRGLSNKSEFNRIQHLKGANLEIEKLEGVYDGNIFTRDQIKKLAVDYHLRFLQSTFFTGSMDIMVASKIKEFARQTNTPMDDYTLGRKYFILAPEECFTLKEMKFISPKPVDPAIFYKIDETHFRLIHKWGQDFTIFRLIEGYKWKGWWQYHMVNMSIIFPVIVLLGALLFDPMLLAIHPIISSAIVFILTFIATLIFRSGSKLDDFDPIPGFFTPFNWDSDTKLIS